MQLRFFLSVAKAMVKYHPIRLALPVLFLAATFANAADPILIDDFNDGNDDGWIRFDLLSPTVGPAIHDPSSGEYRITSSGQVNSSSSVRGEDLGAVWEASQDDPFYSDGLYRTTIKITENATSAQLLFRGNNSPAGYTSYGFGAASFNTGFPDPGGPNPGGVFFFNRQERGVSTKVENFFVNEPHINDEWILEAGAIGDKLSMKWWPVGGEEPAEPQWEWIDPKPHPPGEFGMDLYISQQGVRATRTRPPWRLGAAFDDIYFIPSTMPLGVLQAGDADQDKDFDQFDLIQVQQAAKYLTAQPATWGEGDWNGAPGGSPGNPPEGDGLFNQLDIVAAQQGAAYLTGPYAALRPDGTTGDGQTSLVYYPATGELSVDAPAGTDLTSINIDSAAGIFTGQSAQNLGGSFDNDADDNIFKATFGSSFGSLSFGKVAQAGLSEDFVLGDLTVIGSLAGGGDLGNVDLVYVPEPSSVLLLVVGLVIGFARSRSGRR